MSRLIYAVLAFVLLAPASHFQPRQSADSDSKVKPVLENEYVRITQADFAPGDKSSFTVPEGRSAVVVRLHLPKIAKAGDQNLEASFQYDRAVFMGEEEMMSHTEPAGGTGIREVRIEIKKTPPASTFEKDAVKLDPNHNILLFENDKIRVVQVHFAPGEQGPVVDKRPRVIILLTEMHAQVMKPGGTPQDRNGTAGTIQFSLGGSQATMNLNVSRLDNTVIEFKSN